MSIKVVTVDFWNTLFDSSNGIERNAYRKARLFEVFNSYDTEITSEQYDIAIQKSWEFFNNVWFSSKRTPMPYETIEFFWDYLKLPYDRPTINFVADFFAQSTIDIPPKLNLGVLESLEFLSGKYKIGLVSDTGFTPGSLLRKLLEKEGVLGYLSSFSFSDETGVSKPHPKAFETILSEIGCLPEEAIHIGDIEKTDIVGAKSIGMKAILYTGDKTGTMNKMNPSISVADAQSDSWDEICNIVDAF